MEKPDVRNHGKQVSFNEYHQGKESGNLTVTSAAGSSSGTTAISVTPTKEAGNLYKYKVANAAVSVVDGQNVQTWTAWDGSADITAASGKVITIVECDSEYKAVRTGNTTVTSA